MVFDPIKKTSATIRTNVVGSVAGALAGVWLVRRYSPIKGTWGMALGIVGGAVLGAYSQQALVAKKGAARSAKEAKNV